MRNLRCAALVAGLFMAVGSIASAAADTPVPTAAPAATSAAAAGFFTSALMSPMAAIIGERQVCVTSVAVRDSDLSHVNSYLYYGDFMNVQDYVAKLTNPGDVFAKGIAHARVGDHFGYVAYNSHTFRNTNGNCV